MLGCFYYLNPSYYDFFILGGGSWEISQMWEEDPWNKTSRKKKHHWQPIHLGKRHVWRSDWMQCLWCMSTPMNIFLLMQTAGTGKDVTSGSTLSGGTLTCPMVGSWSGSLFYYCEEAMQAPVVAWRASHLVGPQMLRFAMSLRHWWGMTCLSFSLSFYIYCCIF